MEIGHKCVFCSKPNDEATHIDMTVNSLYVNADCIVEFSYLLRDLLNAKVTTNKLRLFIS